MRYIVETKNSLSMRLKGPIDPVNGWPTIHDRLVITADTQEQAEALAEIRFPNNVELVYPD